MQERDDVTEEMIALVPEPAPDLLPTNTTPTIEQRVRALEIQQANTERLVQQNSQSIAEKDWNDTKLLDRKQDITLRRDLTDKLYKLICVYLYMVAVLLFWVACGCLTLSDNVLITLLGTTTATVLGLFAIVARYFFQTGEKPND